MPFAQIGDRLINLDRVTSVQANFRAAHPARPRGSKDEMVNDAVEVRLTGQSDPIVLFDDEGQAFLKAAGFKAKAPEPAPAPKPVKAEAAPAPPPTPAAKP